jgi:hypothetical protein
MMGMLIAAIKYIFTTHLMVALRHVNILSARLGR